MDGMSAGLDSPPASPTGPARAEMGGMGWGAKPDGGLGPEASDPQVQALQGVKLIEMGAQVLASSVPELAGPVQAFVQQIAQLVPQMLNQQQMGGAPSPVPGGPPQGAPQGAGMAPMG